MRQDDSEPTSLHAERIDAVKRHLVANGVQSVLDLGCGPGELIARLLPERQFKRIVGIDISVDALAAARASLGLDAEVECERIRLLHASFTHDDDRLTGFDAATLVETIEHIDPGRLSAVEQAVFRCYLPRIVIVTTPNADYNILHGVRPGMFRHADHRFEWGRARFRQWATGVAQRNTYAVIFIDIGEPDPEHGSSTQMAVFKKIF
jgi:3' terminal RNA ribose 2'-O-methyltransferase Hen1